MTKAAESRQQVSWRMGLSPKAYGRLGQAYLKFYQKQEIGKNRYIDPLFREWLYLGVSQCISGLTDRESQQDSAQCTTLV